MRYAISTDAHIEVWTGTGPVIADVVAGEVEDSDVDAAVLDLLIRSGLATVVKAPKSKKETPDVTAQ
jgi:hypothetical protein